MTYILKVMVQLPDGSFKRCPIAVYAGKDEAGHDKYQVKEEESEKEAFEWARYCLPDRVAIYEKD